MKRLVILFASCACLAGAAEFTVLKDLPYYAESAYTNDYMRTYCKFNLRVPKGVTNFATVVWYHGGGLIRGSKGEFYRAPQDDVASVSVGYRLLTNATPTECVSDAAAALAWTLKHIAEYGGDPRKVFVSGSSGGGYLTLMLGMDPKWLAPHGYKPTDLAGLFPQTGQASTHFTIRSVNGDKTSTYITKVDEWAPLSYASKDLPPMLIQTGEPEIDIYCRAEENRLLYASLLALGHPDVEYHGYMGRRHGTMHLDTAYWQEDFIRRRVREIDGAAFSGGPNKTRACLEKGCAAGLKGALISMDSTAAYETEATCVMKGNRADLSGNADWMLPILEQAAAIACEAAGEKFPSAEEPLPANASTRMKAYYDTARELAIFKYVTDPLGMPRTKPVRKDGKLTWVSSAADAIRLAQMIAHGGEWHGRRILPAEACAKAFPLPYGKDGRFFAAVDGSARVLFTGKDVASDPAFAALTAEWKGLAK